MELRNIFDVAASSMSAQMVRLNSVASNMANAQSVSATEEGAFRPLRPVFETVHASAMAGGHSSLATTRVADMVQLDRPPVRSFRPDHPLADKDGFVYAAQVNPEEEMVEMMEASRQYENVLETVSTLRTLMARTVRMGQ